MACIGVGERGGRLIVNTQAKGGVFLKRGSGMKLAVQIRHQMRGGDFGAVPAPTAGRDQIEHILQLRPQGTLDGCHKQRRRNSFPRHVGDRKSHLRLTHHFVIVVVAGHQPRRLADGPDPQRAHFGNGSRKELALNFARNLDLGFQPLLFLGDHQKLLQVLRHAVEGMAQLRELIFAGHFDAVRIIALR